MFFVAVNRIKSLLKDEKIEFLSVETNEVVKNWADQLGLNYQLVEEESKAWLTQRPLLSLLNRKCPGFIDNAYIYVPFFMNAMVKLKANMLYGGIKDKISKFIDMVKKSDLILFSGGGYINDIFGTGEKALNLVLLAKGLGKPVAMMGQGIGPIQSDHFFNKARRALPKVDLIALREKKYSLPLLYSLGVQPENVVVTGDDAIEIIAQEKELPQIETNSGIGINVRVSFYSDICENVLRKISHVLDCIRKKYFEFELYPIPIQFRGSNNDLHNILQIFNCIVISFDREKVDCFNIFDNLINNIRKCRIVITGSYHAAVFALSMGIPVISIYGTEYYRQKFVGLADMFEAGCVTIDVNREDFEKKMIDVVSELYLNASQFREILLKKRDEQVRLGKEAYNKLLRLIR